MKPDKPVVYLNATELDDLSVDQLLEYKQTLSRRSVTLLAEATSWTLTTNNVRLVLHDKLAHLELELELAELDRIESSEANYGQIGYIH